MDAAPNGRIGWNDQLATASVDVWPADSIYSYYYFNPSHSSAYAFGYSGSNSIYSGPAGSISVSASASSHS